MNVYYKPIPLTPYPGTVHVFSNLNQMRKWYENKTGNPYPYKDNVRGGRYIKLEGKDSSQDVWLVYGKKSPVLAHEFSHVLLKLFEEIGSEPGCGNGEPFCYMMSYLMMRAGAK